jgi:hypothetical protein
MTQGDPDMYAQLVEGGTTPELRQEMDRIVREELLPALHTLQLPTFVVLVTSRTVAPVNPPVPVAMSNVTSMWLPLAWDSAPVGEVVKPTT